MVFQRRPHPSLQRIPCPLHERKRLLAPHRQAQGSVDGSELGHPVKGFNADFAVSTEKSCIPEYVLLYSNSLNVPPGCKTRGCN